MRNKKAIAAVVVLLLVVAQVVTLAGAAYTDVPEGAWYAGVVNKWGHLLAEGDEVEPDAEVTRAEFAHVLNSVMKFSAADADFADVSASEKYAADIGALQAAGVVIGVGDGNFAPNDNVTRAQVAVMFARAFALEPQGTPDFTDAADIPSYAAPYVNSLQEMGYFHGEPDGDGMSFVPNRLFMRSEIFQVVENAAANYVNTAGTVSEVIPGNVIITEANAVLKDVTVEGNIIISPSVGDGDVTLDNVILNGTLIIRGGGENSIKLEGKSSIARVFVEKSSGGGVRLAVGNDVAVSAVLVNGGKGKVVVDGPVASITMRSETAALEVNGTVGSLNVSAPNAAVAVSETAVVTDLYVAPEAAGTSLAVAGKVEAVQVAAPAAKVAIAETAVVASVAVSGSAAGSAVDNKGKVENLVVKAADAEVANTGSIDSCQAPESVTVTGTAPTTVATVEAGSVNDVYA